MKKVGPNEILEAALARVPKNLSTPTVSNANILKRIEYVSRCLTNRAGVRLLMSCMLAKIDRPGVDPRCPYTEIGGSKSFSGRTYDEGYITSFISRNRLPCNSTTAFLTPALRNMDAPLTTETTIVGKPPEVYKHTLQLLDDVAKGKVSAENVLTETVRILVLLREERRGRMIGLLAGLKDSKGSLPLSAEAIVRLIGQHLACKNSSRLPVLIVAAAYKAAFKRLGEQPRPLKRHNAADEQTGAVGDVEICLVSDDRMVTIYEMKTRKVTTDDIDRAIQKISTTKPQIDNYVFITTEVIEKDVSKYAETMYEATAGSEVVVLDCIGFLRHYLHLFFRLRTAFLDAYQDLVLAEPTSAVNQPLKEAFLTLRQAAEADE
jgi:hypothetical protein